MLPEVDIVLLMGSMSIHGVKQVGHLPKPVIGVLGVYSNKVQQIPITEHGTSGEKNFTYVKFSTELFESIKQFEKLHDFKHPAFIVDKGFATIFSSKEQAEELKALNDYFGINVQIVMVDKDAKNAIEKINDQADAVIIALPYQFNDAQLKLLYQGINQKKIPSYSMNQSDVSLGALFSQGNKNDLNPIMRKVGIMVDDILAGEKARDMNVLIKTNQELYMNMATAREIAFPITFEVMFSTNIVNPVKDDAPTYTLEKIIEIALEENLSIKISYADLTFSEIDVKQATSQYLPDVALSGDHKKVDEKSAPQQVEHTVSSSLSVKQTLFSEQTIATIRMKKYLQEAQRYTTDQKILDVLLDCYSAYLNILQAKNQSQIQQENLNNNRINLELASLKSQQGAADNSDVYRFEGEQASSMQSVIEAQTNYFMTKLELNNLLNNTLEDDFEVGDIDSDSDLLNQFKNSSLAKAIEGPLQMTRITEFLVKESQLNYPRSKNLLANYQSLERQEKMNKCKYYLPTFSLSGQTNKNLHRSGIGSTPPTGTEFINSTWNVGMTASYPIFSGNRRHYDLQKTKVQKLQMEDKIAQNDNTMELNVRKNVYQLLSSSTDLNYSKTARDNKQRNFELLRDKYQNGQITITQLLDAQNAYLNAKLNFANSTYDYLFAFLQLENSLGFHSQVASQQQKDEFENRFQQYLNSTNE